MHHWVERCCILFIFQSGSTWIAFCIRSSRLSKEHIYIAWSCSPSFGVWFCWQILYETLKWSEKLKKCLHNAVFRFAKLFKLNKVSFKVSFPAEPAFSDLQFAQHDYSESFLALFLLKSISFPFFSNYVRDFKLVVFNEALNLVNKSWPDVDSGNLF